MRFQIFVYMFVPWTEKIFKDDAGYFLRITKHNRKGDDDSRHIPSKKETASRNRF